MNYLIPIIALSAGLVLGGVAVWMFIKARIAVAAAETRAGLEPQIAALTERVSAKEEQVADQKAVLAAEEAQKTQVGLQLQQETIARAAAEARASRIPQMEAQLTAS